MQRTEPMAEAMRAALEPHARKLRKRLQEARAGDAEGIHGSRVTLRRLREGIDIMGRTVFDPERTAALARDLRRIERALGPARDDDVLLADLERWTEQADVETKAGIEPLRRCLEARRAKHAEALLRELRRGRSKRAVQRVRRWLRGHPRDLLPGPKNPARQGRSLVRHFLFDQIWRAYEQILAYEVRPQPDVEVIHKVRSACRQLRFTLEIFSDALAPPANALVDAIRALQSRLGDLHDDAVACALVDGWRARGKLPSHGAIEAYVGARRDHMRRLHAEFEREWQALVAPAFQEALFRAVSGGAPAPGGALRLVPAA